MAAFDRAWPIVRIAVAMIADAGLAELAVVVGPLLVGTGPASPQEFSVEPERCVRYPGGGEFQSSPGGGLFPAAIIPFKRFASERIDATSSAQRQAGPPRAGRIRSNANGIVCHVILPPHHCVYESEDQDRRQ